MCRLLKIVVSVFICSMFPMLLLLWCTHRMCMEDGSTLGLLISISIVGSSYVIVSAGICAITCVSRNGPMCGEWFWYHLLSGMVSMVMVLGSFFAASLAQCMAVSASFSL